MTENTTNKKRIALHITVAVILSYIFRTLYNAASSLLIANVIPQELLYKYAQLVRLGLSLIESLLVMIAFLVIGHMLTKDKSKTMIFAGSVFFGRQVVTVISIFFTLIVNLLFNFEIITSTTRGYILSYMDIPLLPLIIFASYFFYTALEGINPKFKKSLADTEFTLKKARIRYIVCSLIGGVVISVITNVPNYIFALLQPDNSVLISTTNDIVGLLSNIASLLLLVFMGYMAYKNHVDTITFGASSAIANGFSTIIFSAAKIPLVIATTYINELIINGAENIGTLSAALTAVNISSTLIVSVPAFIVTLAVMKHFFPEAKITLFTDKTASEERDVF